MCFKIVYIVIYVLNIILCCDKLSDPITLLYRDGDILDLEFTHMSFSNYIKTIEFSGQICGTSEFTQLLVTDLTSGRGSNRFWKIMTLFEKIDKNLNLCSYYTTVLETTKGQRQMQLFQLVYDTERSNVSAENPTPKIFHYKITVNWQEHCFDANETTELAETVPKIHTEPIEDEIYHQIEYTCEPDNPNQPSSIHFVSNHPVILSTLATVTGYVRIINTKLYEYDNNTYLSCGNRPSALEFGKSKWVPVKVKSRETPSALPDLEKLYRYREGETYEFECTQRPPRTLSYLKINENNEIVSAASSNEFTWNLAKHFKLTKKDHNSKLVCIIIECEYNYTAKYDDCSRRELKVVKLVMRNDFLVDKVTTSIQTVPSDKCQLPAYPPKGRYQVFNAPNASPFQISDFWILDITCDLGFGIVGGENRLFCTSGVWSPSNKLPQCVPFCKLTPHPSVKYSCRSRDGGSLFTRPCEEYEPPGMLAIAECKKPDYISNDELPSMQCTTDGIWSNTPTCMPACGEVTPGGLVLINNGEFTKLGELPWHVGIYQKTSTPYKQICGGSIIRPSVVISAAHCFWDEKRPEKQKLRLSSEFAVAAGKLYRPWDDPVDNKYSQTADVTSINIPSRFHGQISSYTDDLAVVLLSKSFEYKPHIAPVCLNFDDYFDRIQLSKGMTGKVAGWGVTSAGGESSPELKVVDLPIVPYLECYETSPLSFRRYITADKICAGYKNKSTAVCTGDSGGGLVVAGNDRGVTRYYLRGVVSAAPDELISCTANEVTAFTHVIRHYDFIKTYLSLQ